MSASVSALPGDLAWASDACDKCVEQGQDRRCSAVLPVGLVGRGDDWVSLVYRCMHGHDWVTSYGLDFALAGAVQSKAELEDLGPEYYWPPRQ